MPTKIIDFGYFCDAYELAHHKFAKAIKKGAEIPENCATCRYLMFGCCWLKEANEGDHVVMSASDGNVSALEMVHARLEA